MKLGWKGGVGALISVFLIWWTLRGESPGEIWAVIRGGNFWLLGASVFVATAGFLGRALRWRLLLQPIAPETSLDSRFGAVTIGFMANNLLPARVGEVLRGYALSRMERVSMSGALGTLVVERVLDGIVLLLFLILPPLLPGFPEVASGSLRAMLGGASLGLALVLGGLVVLLLWPAVVVVSARRLLTRFPEGFTGRAVDALESFLGALQIVRRPALLARAVAWSLVLWTWHGLSFWLGMAAFGIREGFPAAVFTEAAVGFGVAIPSAPGFFGTFHAAASWALQGVYGVDAPRALAFAYGFHLGGFFPVTFIGLWYARRLGLSLKEMGRGGGGSPGSDAAARGGGASGAAAPPGPRASSGPDVVEVDAPAKVNLFLHVLEREASGYHRIQTLFQSLELADRLRVRRTPTPEVTLEVSGFDAGPPAENLARRAATAFLASSGVEAGVHIRLEKRIPAGAGLGGGSSDAAATLRALDALFPGAVPRRRLLEIAAALGSDVPFFLGDSPLALGEGRGELLTPLAPLPAAHVILALPELSVSTAWAYGALDRQRGGVGAGDALGGRGLGAELPAAFARGGWDQLAGLAVNDFEEVVTSAHALVAEARSALRGTGARVVLLSGSGSSVFALYPDGDAADRELAGIGERRGVRFVRTRTRTSVPEPERGGGPRPVAPGRG